jgi:hypothetical protein
MTLRKTPESSEQNESESRGFRQSWWSYSKYEIRDGAVVPFTLGKQVNVLLQYPPDGLTYLPMTRLELPGEFAKLASGAATDILEFVQQYGLLGYYYAQELEPVGAARVIPGPATAYAAARAGDPISWIIAHAKTVELALQVGEAFDDQARLRECLEFLTSESDGRPEKMIAFSYAVRGRRHPTSTRLYRLSNDHRTNALRLLSTILAPNLRGISRTIDVNRTGQRIVSLFQFQGLIDAIYWHLADVVTGGTIKRCAFPGCGHFFIATNLKRKYCPPPMGFRGESACANSDRQRIYRINQKAETAQKERTRYGRKRSKKGR